jgi:hypothetical protein
VKPIRRERLVSKTQMKFRVIICGVQIIYGTVVKIKMKFRVFAKKKKVF